MGIADEDVATVKAKSDIVAVVSQYLQLRRVGRRWTGLCPFHQEKTPSFSVNGEENLYYCFGCQASGDTISFVREIEKLDFVGAVEWLARKAGITLRYTDPQEGERRQRRGHLIEVMTRAVDWYHQRLLTAPDAGAARSYLRSRGIDGDVVREYRLGWAPDNWDELCRSLRLDGKTAEEAGLGFLNSRERLQDTFRARVLFPIFDPQGSPVSFGGRVLPGHDDPHNQAKYKNTPETALYHKSRVLYGMDRAKTAMVATDTAVVCEGYTDVIAFQMNGVGSAVATCGTALTDEHVDVLRRHARRMVLAFDTDSAGREAAARFYRWEKEHDLQVVVAELRDSADPADAAQIDPESLGRAVEKATPFMQLRLDRMFAKHDLNTPEGRAHAHSDALELLAEHPDRFVRDQYLMEVSGRCRVDPELLRPQLDQAVRRQGRSPTRAPAAGRKAARAAPGGGDHRPPHPADTYGAEPPNSAPDAAGTSGRSTPEDRPAREVLRHAVHNPGEVAAWLAPQVFSHPLHRAAFQTLVEAANKGGDIHMAIDLAGDEQPQLVALLYQLSVEEPESEPFEAVRRLLSELARTQLQELSYAAEASDDTQLLDDSHFLSRTINGLSRGDSAGSSAEALLAWLRQRVGDGG